MITVPDTHQEADAMRVGTLDARRADRITGGVDAALLQQLGQLGYERWLDAQLHPKPVALPVSVSDRIAQMPISRESLPTLLRENVARRKASDDIADDAQKKAAQQAYQKGASTRWPTTPRSAGC